MNQLTKLRVRALLGLICLASFTSSAQQNAPQACYLPVKSNVAYSEVLELAVASPSEVLAYGDDPLQYGELWLPKLPQGVSTSFKSPLVVFIHGGCWLNAYDISHTHAFSTALAQAGYAVWSIEYRRTGDAGGGWPGSFDDILAAIKHIDNLDGYPLDLNKVAIAGHSAGGHLALLANQKSERSFAASIGLAAIVDIEKYAQGSNSCETATPQFMGGSPAEKPLAYQQANPTSKPLPKQTVLIHGSLDAIVSPSQAAHFSDQLVSIDGAGHFDMIHPGTPAYQQFLKQLAIAFQ